jgi:ADP-heptose:LPS heptosyltransferase
MADSGAGQTRILFVRTDRLGETLLNLPAIAALNAAFPRSAITLLVHPELSELLKGLRGVEAVLEDVQDAGRPWWFRAIRLAGQLRARRFDIVVISNPRKELHLGALLAGIPTRVGYDRKWGWTLTHRLSDDRALGARHEVEYNLQLLTLLGIAVPSTPALRIAVRPEAQESVSRLLKRLSVQETERLVAVHPWTSNPRKQWPLERSRELIHRLRQVPGLIVAVIGGQDERRQVQQLLPAGTSEGLVNLVGQLSLSQLAALLQRVRVLATNDSGPMHLAAAVGTPVVALFGTQDAGSHPRRWGPWGSGHTVIHRPLEEISVDEVVQAIHRYLT